MKGALYSWCLMVVCACSTSAPKGDYGAACQTGPDCRHGNCVDGTCCNTECTGQCEACDLAGSRGTCTPVVGAVRGNRAPCAGSGVCAGACDGVGTMACAYPTVVCTGASCLEGTETLTARCDGTGACPAGQTQACSPFVCGAAACKTSCDGADANCSTGYYCSGALCVPKLGLGAECTGDNQCGDTLTCLQGQVGHRYCGSASCGTCRVVENDGTTCVNATDKTDPKAECTSTTYGPETCVAGACAITCLPDLIAYWNFDDSTVSDSVGSYDGELAAGTYVDSYVGKGVYTARRCSGGDNSGARVANFLDFAADSFSIELSHTPACRSDSWQLYSLFSSGPANVPGVAILNQTTNPYGTGDDYKFRFILQNASGGVLDLSSATVNFNCSATHHVVAIRDRTLGKARLFVDGALEGEAPDTLGDLRSQTTVYIGGVYHNDGCGWGQSGGTMDAAAFYHRALTSTEVAALHARWQARKLACGP